MSAMKKPGESDMDFFERRYQERVGVRYLSQFFSSQEMLPSRAELNCCHLHLLVETKTLRFSPLFQLKAEKLAARSSRPAVTNAKKGSGRSGAAGLSGM